MCDEPDRDRVMTRDRPAQKAMPTDALAQSRTFYDSSGRVSGRSTTDTSGTTTFDDAGGRGVGIVTTQQKGEQRR